MKAIVSKAIDCIQKYPQDLLIIDLIMPGGIDGVEIYRQVQEINPVQQAIMISGYSQPCKAEEAKDLGIRVFITKPLSIKSLAVALRKELGKEAVTRS